ncbi:MAG: hypothetical protein HYY18_08925 [Planctomycetes bacterium]|nr:hypothetical protein [Planctomycetota bacterium]
MTTLKRTVPLGIALVAGLVLILQGFVPHPVSGKVLTWTQSWVVIIAGVSILLGVGSLVQAHATKIHRQSRGWFYSAVTLGTFGLTALGFFHPKGIEPGGPLDWSYQYVMNEMSATMFSILGFFIASAAFRAFRARSVEATLLLVAAVIIMLGQVPVGAYLPGVPQVATWVLEVPTTAAKRAIILGVALGSIATALRIIFGIERAYLGGSE